MICYNIDKKYAQYSIMGRLIDSLPARRPAVWLFKFLQNKNLKPTNGISPFGAVLQGN
jgi:hypothetical protein